MVDQEDIMLLIQNKLYVVIERLVFSHCEFLYVEHESVAELVDDSRLVNKLSNSRVAHQIAKLTGGNTTNSSSEFDIEDNMQDATPDEYEGGDG